MNIYEYEKQKIEIYKKYKKVLIIKDEIFKDHYENGFYIVDETYEISPNNSITGMLLEEFHELYEKYLNVTGILKEVDNYKLISFADQMLINTALECVKNCSSHISESLSEIDNTYRTDKNLTIKQIEDIEEYIKNVKEEMQEIGSKANPLG